MYGVDLYRRVRLACHREGLSRREASRQFGIDRKTVAKILLHSEPPGYRRRQPPKRSKLAPFTDIIDGILEEDRTVHRKQRHTAKRIFERLRDEHGFTGKQTIVKDYACLSGLHPHPLGLEWAQTGYRRFSTAPISHSRIRYPSSSDFSPMMRPAPPTWRKPAGETALPARTAARRESRSTLKTALASCAAASAARTPG